METPNVVRNDNHGANVPRIDVLRNSPYVTDAPEGTMKLPSHRTSVATDNRPLGPSVLALARKIREGNVTYTALCDIARLFAYGKHLTDSMQDRDTSDALRDFADACMATYGSVPENVMLRFKKGTVQGGDLIHLFALEV